MERELAALRSHETPATEAMEHAGDPTEVGEYLDAQRDQELVARRIAMLESWLREGQVVDAARPHELAELGARTQFKDLASGVLSSFELVSSPEASIERGRLSIDSPVGHALLGHHAGEIVEVRTPTGRRLLQLLTVS